MSASLLLAHGRVFINLLDGDNMAPALTVQNGEVEDGVSTPYVLVYLSLRTPSGREIPQDVSLEKYSDVIVTTAYCHSVGEDAEAAISVAGRVRRALLGVEPAIAARVCYPIQHDDGAPVDRDETTGDNRFDLVDVYSFKSLPA